jgi:hypothetical protein
MYVVYSIVVRRNIYIHGNEIVVYETSYVYQFMVYRKQTILHNSIYLPWFKRQMIWACCIVK